MQSLFLDVFTKLQSTAEMLIITSSLAIAERPRDARFTSIRKIAKCNF